MPRRSIAVWKESLARANGIYILEELVMAIMANQMVVDPADRMLGIVTPITNEDLRHSRSRVQNNPASAQHALYNDRASQVP